jgi:hypothetical protein
MRYEDVPNIAMWEQDSAMFEPRVTVAALRGIWESRSPVPAAAATVANSRGGLKDIDKQIRAYGNAWSPMAKQNVLADLRRAIDAWVNTHPASQPPAMAALSEVVRRKLGPPGARYSEAICIAYQVKCDVPLKKEYFHGNADDLLDMETKCEELSKAIALARAALPQPEEHRALKIFMAPEFFFRGKYGAYSPEVVSRIIPKMRSLRTGSPAYQNWLFIFGTAVAAYDPDPETKCPECNGQIEFAKHPKDPDARVPVCKTDKTHKIHRRVEVQNVALIQHGLQTHLVAKEYISKYDYEYGLTMQAGTQAASKLKWSDASSQIVATEGSRDQTRKSFPGAKTFDERLGGCIFTIDGIRIGLEICLDHVSPDRHDHGRVEAYASTVQILLIPACGMEIKLFSCKQGGIVFNVDGDDGESAVRLNNGIPGSSAPQQTLTAGRGKVAIYKSFPIPA